MSNERWIRWTRRSALMAVLAIACLSSSRAAAQGFEGCEEWQLGWIEDAIQEARVMVDEPKSTARFEEWFGPVTDDHWNYVQRVGKRVTDGFTYNIGGAARSALELFDAVGIGCGCRFTNRDLAEVTGDSSFNVCNSFFNSLPDGVTRGGVFIHEIIHFIGGQDTQRADTLLEMSAYDYSRFIVIDPVGIVNGQWGNEPFFLNSLSWPLVEPENYRFFFENPDRL